MGFDLTNAATSVRKFSIAREWEQFHSIRNLTLALTGEVGELAAILQWKTDDDLLEMLENRQDRSRIEEEVADIAIYLLRIAQRAVIDLAKVIDEKILANGVRYPEEDSRGKSRKYRELRDE